MVAFTYRCPELRQPEASPIEQLRDVLNELYAERDVFRDLAAEAYAANEPFTEQQNRAHRAERMINRLIPAVRALEATAAAYEAVRMHDNDRSRHVTAILHPHCA